MKNILERLFVISLMISILLGTGLVFGQMIGLLIRNADLVINSKEWLLQPAVISASIFGMIAFIYGYLPSETKE